MKVVSKLPDWSDWQWRWKRSDRWWISANNRDDLVAVYFQSGMEAHDNVVGEDALWILLRSASFQRQLNFVAQVAMADDLASTVTIEVRVGDSVKLFVEFQIHLCKTLKRETVTISVRKKLQYVELSSHLRGQTRLKNLRLLMLHDLGINNLKQEKKKF